MWQGGGGYFGDIEIHFTQNRQCVTRDHRTGSVGIKKCVWILLLK